MLTVVTRTQANLDTPVQLSIINCQHNPSLTVIKKKVSSLMIALLFIIGNLARF